MKKVLLSVISLALALILVSCSAPASGVGEFGELVGCYSLVFAEYNVDGERYESFSGEDRLIVKIREDGGYLMKLDGRVGRGGATLTDGVLTLTGDPEPFSHLGDLTDLKIEFGDRVTLTATLYKDGVPAAFTAILAETGNYDDAFFENEELLAEYIGVRGLADSYPRGGFTADGVEVGFRVGGAERWIPLLDVLLENKEGDTVGSVSGEFMGCAFHFEYSVMSIDLQNSFPNAEFEYTGEPITHLPSMPDGCYFVPDGEVSFVDAGVYTVSGRVCYRDVDIGYISSELYIKKKVVAVPGEISFRRTEDGRAPEGILGDGIAFVNEVFDVGVSDTEVTVVSGNYCFPDGGSVTHVNVRVLPPLVPASEFSWVIPTEKILFSEFWRDEMPYLTYRGEMIDGVEYNYRDDGSGNIAAGFSAGHFEVRADFTNAGVEPDGALPDCTVELSPVVISLPDSSDRAYTGQDISILPEDFNSPYTYVYGDYVANSVGKYTFTIEIPSYLYKAGAVFIEGGLDRAEITWSIVKQAITLNVDTSAFNNGLSFEYDGVSRYISAVATPAADVVMYVNGEAYSPDYYAFTMPGRYEVRIELVNDFYIADPYEATVIINKKKINLSDFGITWGECVFTYTGREYTVGLLNVPDCLGVKYSGNVGVNADVYHATASFYLKDSYGEIYEYTDTAYVLEEDWSISPAVLDLPVMDGSEFVYTGSVINYFIPSYPVGAATVSGGSAVNAGSYELSVILSQNYVFGDGTREFKKSWTVKPVRIQLAPLSLAEESREWKEGSPFTPTVYNLNRLLEYFDFTLEGDASATEPGKYTAKYTFTPKAEYKDNYEFVYYEGGAFNWQTPFEYSFEVLRAELVTPISIGSYVYTGSAVIPTLAGFDGEYMEVSSAWAVAAGKHSLTVTVLDPTHYCFVSPEGERVSTAEVSYEIERATLTLSDFVAPTETYDGKSHPVSLYYIGVGGESFAAELKIYEDGSLVNAVLGAGYYRIEVGMPEGDYATNYYVPNGKNITFHVKQATINTDAFVWDINEVTYDGQVHTPTLISGYPTELDFNVFCNQGPSDMTTAGEYIFVAVFNESDNYLAAKGYHSFRINRLPVAPPTVDCSGMVYNGGEQQPVITAEDKDFGEYSYTVVGNRGAAAGEYTAEFTAGINFLFILSDGSHSTEYKVKWSIDRAHHDLSGIAWSNREGVYLSDGTAYDFTLTGVPDTVWVSYSMGSVQKVGSYTKIATLVSRDEGNYYPPVLDDPDLLSFDFEIVGATYGDYVYYVNDNQVYITEYRGSAANVVLPAKINGFTIYSVGQSFAGHSEIETLDLTALSDGYGSLGADSLAGLDSLWELYMPAVSKGMMLSDIFGGKTPSTLTVIHSSGLIGYYLSQLDCPTLKELYIRVGRVVDLSDIVFDLDLLVINSTSAETLLLDFHAFAYVPTVYNGSFVFGFGDYVDGFGTLSGPGVGFNAGVRSKDSIAVADGSVYLVEEDGTATFLRARGTGRVEIPASVTIGGSEYTVDSLIPYAFHERSDITELTVGESIINVGSSAFHLMSGLTTVNWNATAAEGAGRIKLDAFGTLNIGEGVVSLPEDFMRDSYGLREVIMPSTLVSLGENCFNGCTNLIHVTLSPILSAVASGSFSDTPKLADIYDPAGVASAISTILNKRSEILNPTTLEYIVHIYSAASERAVSHSSDGFYWFTHGTNKYIVGYDGDEHMVLPSGGAVYIARYAFAYHRDIASAVIGSSYAEVNNGAFLGCDSLESVSLGNAIQKIGYAAFMDCPVLDGVILPASVTVVDNSAFSGCVSLSALSLPEGLTYLGNSVLSGCTSIRELVLPAGIKELPASILYNCTSLTDLTLHGGVESFGLNCLAGCSSLESIELPAALTWVGDQAFSGTAIRRITLPSTLEHLGTGVFSDCLSLETVWILAPITRLPEYTFSGCTALSEVVLPDEIEVIGFNAFYECKNINFNLWDGLQTVENFAFKGCSSFNPLAIPVTVTYIGAEAFDGTPMMAEADEQGLYIFDRWLLGYVSGMEKRDIEIPERVVGIAEGALSYADIGRLTLKPTLLIINNSALCYSTVSEIVFSEGLRQIGDSVFMWCESLTEVVLPDSVQHIGRLAFAYCTSLEKLHIGTGIKELGEGIISTCESLTDFSLGNLGIWWFVDGLEFDMTTNEKAKEVLSGQHFYGVISKKPTE